MRNSNSRDKTSTTIIAQNQGNKLMKTQGPPKAPQKQSLNTTQYKIPPTSSKRIESSKNLQTTGKTFPVQQVDFDIQNNMTESKVFLAKQSLQLLKKKMNRTGMSRQKPSNTASTNNNTQKYSQNMQRNNQNLQKNNENTPVASMKKVKPAVGSKTLQSYQPSNNEDQYSNQGYNKNKYQSNKNQNKKVQEKSGKRIQPPQEQPYYNQIQEAPVGKNQDFFALLEKQMQKEANKGKPVYNNNTKNSYSKQPQMSNDEYGEQNIELAECSKGCGRQFNINVLAKHEKICEKVFQSKRKAFDAAAKRAVESEGNFNRQPPVTQNNKFKQTKKQPEKNSNKIPKWKLQSAQFRAGLKNATNIPLTAEEKALADIQKDNLVQCPVCSRRFNDTAAQRHIPFCKNKAKQTNIVNPRPSNIKKK